MAEDERDFIAQTQSKARGYLGRELSPQEMAGEFAKWGISERVDALDRADRDLASSEPLELNEAVRLRSYTSALRKTHERLRKVGR